MPELKPIIIDSIKAYLRTKCYTEHTEYTEERPNDEKTHESLVF